MTTEEKIEIIIVDIFKKILNISDSIILQNIHESLKSKDLAIKEDILANLYEKLNLQREIFGNIGMEIGIAKNKISEANEYYVEKIEINNLLI